MMRAPVSDIPVMLDKVSVRAGAVPILDKVDLLVSSGAPTLVVGPNGAGKSTLLRVCMGLTRPSDGMITWGGRADVRPARRAFLFQRPVMLRRSAGANVAYGLKQAGCARAEIPGRVGELLERVGLGNLAQRPARKLSGGEQQRLALARALARDPDLLLLDEPTANLDPAATRAVEEILRSAAASGIKIVMASHDLGQVRRLAGDVVFLVRGQLREHSPTETFLNSSQSAEAATFVRGDLVI